MQPDTWFDEVDSILAKHGRDPSALIAILQDTQRRIGYLPKPVLSRIASDLGVPVSRVYAVATFYKAFKLKPTGRHVIKVCLGTACHIKGAPEIMQALDRELGVKPEEVTGDGRFSYEAVRCLGCCGLAPVVMIDENFHGKVDPRHLKHLLAQYQ